MGSAQSGRSWAGRGKPGRQVPRGCFLDVARGSSMPIRWRLTQPHYMEKITGLQGVRSGNALWNAGRLGSLRCAGGSEAFEAFGYLSPNPFPDNDLQPPGIAVRHGRLVEFGCFQRPELAKVLDWWAWGWSSVRPLAGEAASPVPPVRSFPSWASPPTGTPRTLGPPSAVFMAHTCCLPRRAGERRSFLWLETSPMGACESSPGLSAQSDGFGAVVPHGLLLVFLKG